MTQQNCKPCQGIQSITPRPLVNLIGQHQLNYRVGDYSAFYETMLAALSRNLLPTELLQNVDSIGLQSQELFNLSNQQPSPLRYLTARDRDDPSIAMLDAWAVLADLLTFYNERYLNEAYLNTATQSPSLFELANMVGYAPRPGLSSSVYLAFEVDDRGEEVLIQAGTPAKSTPIPGSGQTPETFETSRPIIGRPSFNKIRPRLTRPQQLDLTLNPNLDRIYLDGTGLRIKPNDYLVITSESGKISKPLRVKQAEERNQGNTRKTVVHFDENSLSPKSLVRELQTYVRNLESALRQSRRFKDSYLDSLRNRDLIPLIPDYTQSLEEADHRTEMVLLSRLMNAAEPLGLFSVLSTIADQVQRIHTPMQLTDPASDYATAIRGYADSHYRPSVKKWHEVLTAITTSGTPMLRALDCIPQLVNVPESPFRLLIPPNNTHLLALNSPLFATPPLFETSNSASPVASATIHVEAPAGISLNQASKAISGPMPDIPAAFQTFILNAVATVDSALLFYQVDITDSVGSSSKIFGIAGIANSLSEEQFFGKLSHDRTQIVTSPSDIIDPYFDCFAQGDPNQYNIKIACTQLPGGSAPSPTQLQGTALQLNSSLKNLSLDNLGIPSPSSGVYIFKFTISESTTTDIVAYAIRRVVVLPATADIPAFTVAAIRDDIDAFQCTRNTSPTSFSILKSALDSCKAIHDSPGLRSGAIFQISNLIPSTAVRLDVAQSSKAIFINSISVLAESIINNISSADLARRYINDIESLTTIANPVQSGNTDKFSLDIFHDTVIPQEPIYGSIQNDIENLVNETQRCSLRILGALLQRRNAVAKDLDTGLTAVGGDCDKAPYQSLRAILNSIVIQIRDLEKEAGKAEANSFEPAAKVWGSITKLPSTSLRALREYASDPNLPQELRTAWFGVLATFTSPNLDLSVRADSFQSILKRLSGFLSNQSVAGAATQILEQNSSIWPQLIAAIEPQKKAQLFSDLTSFRNDAPERHDVWVFRSEANLFGCKSPGYFKSDTSGTFKYPMQLCPRHIQAGGKTQVTREAPDRLFLDGKYTDTVAGSPVLVFRNDLCKATYPSRAFIVRDAQVVPRSEYELNGDATRIHITDASGWWKPRPDVVTGSCTKTTSPPSSSKDGFFVLKNTVVYCNAEKLKLADEAIEDDFPFLRSVDPKQSGTAASQSRGGIFLDSFLPYLFPNTTVFVSGIPASIEQVTALAVDVGQRSASARQAERVTITSVEHLYDDKLFGDSFRTWIEIAAPLANIYWRDSVEICANVVEATHGETVPEVLGSGDASKPFQKFPLRRAPLTRLPAPTKDGKEDQLEITVHNTCWDKASHLVHSGAADEVYELTGNRNNANSTVQFGSGINGARLPTGVENVKALYRVGLGVAGNVQPGQINQLPSPPFGVKGVTNPLRGDGGANADSIAQTRLRIPAMASGMQTLVSLDDYKNFAMLFAGIDKVSVESRSGQITMYVAGCAPDPLDKQGSLFRNLVSAFEQLGDDGALVQLEPHQGLLLHIDASVSVDSRHDWEPVKGAIEKALLLRFGYPQAQLGKSISAADVVRTIQSVDKVNYVVLNRLLGMLGSSSNASDDTRRSFADNDSGTSARVNDHVSVLVNEVCFIHEGVSSTVQLRRLP